MPVETRRSVKLRGRHGCLQIGTGPGWLPAATSDGPQPPSLPVPCPSESRWNAETIVPKTIRKIGKHTRRHSPEPPSQNSMCVFGASNKKEQGEKENGWGQASPKDGRGPLCPEPRADGEPGSGPPDSHRGRPLSGVQMTGRGPRTAGRCHQHGLRLLSTGPRGATRSFPPPAGRPPAPLNVAVGARKSRRFPRGRRTPGFTTQSVGATGDWWSRGGHGVPQSSQRGPPSGGSGRERLRGPASGGVIQHRRWACGGVSVPALGASVQGAERGFWVSLSPACLTPAAVPIPTTAAWPSDRQMGT